MPILRWLVLASAVVNIPGTRAGSFGDARLVGGSSKSQGDLVVYDVTGYSTLSLPLCVLDWGRFEAEAVCRELGYEPQRILATINAFYTHGRADVLKKSHCHFRSIKCETTKIRLNQCDIHEYGLRSSHYGEEPKTRDHIIVGVDCAPDADAFSEDGVAVRLVDNMTSNVGAIEILYAKDEWGTICGKPDNWGHELAKWACKKLGFPGNNSMPLADYFPLGGRKVWQDDLDCPDNTTTLRQCIVRPWGNVICSSTKMVGVMCDTGDSGAEELDIVDIRMVNGTNQANGLLEWNYSGIWLSFCREDNQPISTLALMCRKFGYQWGGFFDPRPIDMEGFERLWSPDRGCFSGTTWSWNIFCDDTVTSLDQCTRGPWETKICRRSDRLWIQCFDEPHPKPPTIEEASTYILEGSNLTLTCAVESRYHIPHFRWYGLEPVGRATDFVNGSYYNRIRTEAYRYLNNRTLTCEASTRPGWRKSAATKIMVVYGPDQHYLLTAPGREGQRVTVTCIVRQCNPAPKLFWNMGDRLLRVATPVEITGDGESGFHLKQQYTFLAKHHHLGRRITCTALNPQSGKLTNQTLSINITTNPRLNVNISPSLAREGDTVSFKCSASSNPAVSVLWKKDPDGIITFMPIFVLESVTQNDTGTYWCVPRTKFGDDLAVAVNLRVVGKAFP